MNAQDKANKKFSHLGYALDACTSNTMDVTKEPARHEANYSSSEDKPLEAYCYTIETDAMSGKPPIYGQTCLSFPSLTIEQMNQIEDYALRLVREGQKSEQISAMDHKDFIAQAHKNKWFGVGENEVKSMVETSEEQEIPENRALIAAAKTLEFMSYEYCGGELWKPPIGKAPDYIQDKPEQPEEWDGGKCPDVGTECELSNHGGDWQRCVIRYNGPGLIVVDHDIYTDQHYHRGNITFRPIKSEAQQAEESRRCYIDMFEAKAEQDDRSFLSVDVEYFIDWHLSQGKE